MNIRKDSLRLVRWAPRPRGALRLGESGSQPPAHVQNQAWNQSCPG